MVNSVISIFFHFSCPPRTFLPALCHIFMDETAPDNILEVTARAITYYLDVSAECSRRIVSVEGAVKALCTRLVVVDISSRTSKDLAEQCVKVSWIIHQSSTFEGATLYPYKLKWFVIFESRGGLGFQGLQIQLWGWQECEERISQLSVSLGTKAKGRPRVALLD